MSSSERAIGRAAARICCSYGKTLSIHQRATSGNDSSRSVSPVGRAVDDDRVPLAGLVVGLQAQQREQLVHPRRHGQLLGRDPVHAALDEQLAEPLLHAGPVALHLLLGLDLLAPEVVAHLGRLAAQLSAAATRPGCGRGRWRRSGSAGRAAAQRRAVHAATDVLPTPPLPVYRIVRGAWRASLWTRRRPGRGSAADLQGAGDAAEVPGQVGGCEPHADTFRAGIAGTVKLCTP